MKNNLEAIVREIKDYFDSFEARYYSPALNPKTHNTYRHDARRAFVKHYLEGNHFLELYSQSPMPRRANPPMLHDYCVESKCGEVAEKNPSPL